MTTVLSHGPLQTDVPDIRPTLQGSVGTATRVSLVAAGAAAGAGLALVATPSATTALTTAVIGAGLVTSLAANWSTCGMSVAGVVAAPKQVDRKGSSTPVRRLGWHALGSVTTGAVTGALIGALGAAMSGYVPIGWALGVWAVVTTSLLYAIPRAYLEASAAFRTITAGAVASAALGFALMVPLLLLMPPDTALLGLLASEIATLIWSVGAFRASSRDGRGAGVSAAGSP